MNGALENKEYTAVNSTLKNWTSFNPLEPPFEWSLDIWGSPGRHIPGGETLLPLGESQQTRLGAPAGWKKLPAGDADRPYQRR